MKAVIAGMLFGLISLTGCSNLDIKDVTNTTDLVLSYTRMSSTLNEVEALYKVNKVHFSTEDQSKLTEGWAAIQKARNTLKVASTNANLSMAVNIVDDYEAARSAYTTLKPILTSKRAEMSIMAGIRFDAFNRDLIKIDKWFADVTKRDEASDSINVGKAIDALYALIQMVALVKK